MARMATVAALAVVVAAGAGWQFRDRLQDAWADRNPPPSAARPAAQPDVLYSWVDKDGVTHYEQQGGKGRRLEYDGSGITPMARPDPDAVERLRKAAGEEEEAAPAEGLMGLRQELQDNARRMQAAKASRSDF